MLDIVGPNEAGRTLALTGELDLVTAPRLIDRIGRLVEADGDLTLELSGVSFVDSQGIRAFIQIARALDGRGRLVLAGASPEVRKLFDIVGVGDFPNVAVEP
jgi:anti-anti-sigma factor